MYQLYLDTTNRKLTVVLLQNNNILESTSFDAWQKQTELALTTINELLVKCQLKLKDINQVVIAAGPGSYTGIRVALTFVKTLKILNPLLFTFIVNSLLLQVGLRKAVSILLAYNKKSYLAVYDQGKTIITPQLVDNNTKIGIVNDLSNFEIIEDLQDCDIISNFQSLVHHFTEIKSIDELQPCYINYPFSQA
ncbi:tRNA (adenosine(37)-N6)-threonylcarbamoyltransferase complex dimerization subunit type 1 TsaB [Spiroplasma endosymbiont of Nebria brevicollis]|uniref:tRNA (adenosine(37)-N6)-threonylcarbamoyltransferase complex dimerization subunit type 1 TsaB n=1 Tax=Spiroplasma endosymbiont of Nebria brevicollis TaxID=3066284 RepID=UPI00313AF2E6